MYTSFSLLRLNAVRENTQRPLTVASPLAGIRLFSFAGAMLGFPGRQDCLHLLIDISAMRDVGSSHHLEITPLMSLLIGQCSLHFAKANHSRKKGFIS